MKLIKPEIIHKAIIIYDDNAQEFIEFLRIIDKGVIICREIDGELMDCGFISKKIIKKIQKLKEN